MGILDKRVDVAGAVAARRACAMAIAVAFVSVLGACTVTPWPSSSSSRLVEDDDTPAAASEASAPVAMPVPAPVVVAEVPAASADASFYRVKAGDTLNRIAAAYKQRAADIAAWNQLPASGTVKVGQLLRVAPPTNELAKAPAAAAAPAKDLAAPTASPAPAKPAPPTALPAAKPAPSAPSASTASAQSATGARTNARLAWPVSGSIVAPFAPGKSRNIVIACAPGAPVKAAAAGRVTYAGSGIKGYGKLVIIKHDAHLITAYGRNGRLLVKQGDTVKLGQQIATSGADAAGVGTLLFEVRENGKPVDPVGQLPRKQP